ncbi:MAG: response regulator [Nitrospinota bacterium]
MEGRDTKESRPFHILVADDNKDNVALVCQLLEERYQVTPGYSGEECILIASMTPPDLILLDVMMPELNGYDVLKRLREDERTREVPVIFLTGRYKDTDRVVKGLEMGAFDYITKPVEESVLLARVRVAERVKLAEEEVKRRREELVAANEELREMDRIKSIFIGSMSHELRTPLNAIMGYTSLIKDGGEGEISPVVKEDLEIVYRSATHLLSLITDIIDVAKIESNRISANFEEVDLGAVLRESILLVSGAAKTKGIEIKLECPQSFVFTLDKKRIYQCLLNIISNSIKYTEKGVVEILARRETDSVLIMVKDTGVGMEESEISKLFTPFVRLDSPVKDKTEGSGLGLYLTQKIVEQVFGGNIKVESVAGSGTTLSLSIPLVS